MSPTLKTLRVDMVYEKGEWQPFLEQLLTASLPIAPDLGYLCLNCTAYYSELRVSPDLTRPISKLRSPRSLGLLFPTHNIWNEIRSDTMLDVLRLLAPLEHLEYLEFRPGYIVEGSTTPSWISEERERLFPNLQELKLHPVECAPSARLLFEALRTPSLLRLETQFGFGGAIALQETFGTVARCFPNLQSGCDGSGYVPWRG